MCCLMETLAEMLTQDPCMSCKLSSAWLPDKELEPEPQQQALCGNEEGQGLTAHIQSAHMHHINGHLQHPTNQYSQFVMHLSSVVHLMQSKCCEQHRHHKWLKQSRLYIMATLQAYHVLYGEPQAASASVTEAPLKSYRGHMRAAKHTGEKSGQNAVKPPAYCYGCKDQ